LNNRNSTIAALVFVMLSITSPQLSEGAAFPATPFISPASGTYTPGRTVTISDATPGVNIYYTTNGSEPTASSTPYVAPIPMRSSAGAETIRAVAFSNASSSSITTATYTIAPQLPQLPEPTFSPLQGAYMSAQEVTISTTTQGVIHYSTDSAPTADSAIYSGPIAATSGKVTIQAIVTGVAGYAASGAAVQTYTIIPATPFISPAAGTYTAGRSVTISDATPGVAIHYTTDGSSPSSNSTLYTGPITLPSTGSSLTVRAFALANWISSSVTSATYSILPALAVTPSPVILPGSGTYTTGHVITISDSLAGATIFCTIDGTTPTQQSTQYTGPFNTSSATGTEVVQAMAVYGGYQPSSISRSQLTLTLSDGVIASSLVTSTPSIEIPANFLGFSHEWVRAQYMMGDSTVGTNPIYQTLVRTLTSSMNGPLVLRIGGGSTNVSGLATPATVEPFVELAQKLNVKFILGVNLASNDLSLAEEQATTFTSTLPRSALMALEIGNEPDGYANAGFRPSSYSYATYLPQYKQWSQGVTASSTSNVPIAGPVFGGDEWIVYAQPDVVDSTFKTEMITQHMYPGCYDPAKPLPTDFLLQPTSSTVRLYYLQPYAAAAHKVGSPFRLAELNSICNGGQPGVSDSFSSALWAIDIMFEDVNAGIDGVNWNSDSDGGPYDLFKFNIWNNGHENVYGLDTVRPLYYGLLFFSEAAGKSASLLRTATVTNSNIKVWATTDSTGNAHLVIINKEQTVGGSVQITLPGYTSGSLIRLMASNYLSTTGVTIGGQTYDNSPDGTLQGSASTETVHPEGDVWTISVKPMSAVLVNLQP
jgi:hypothetical protein